MVYVLDGANGAALHSLTMAGTVGYGADVALAGDLNGDGIGELIVGSHCRTWPSCPGNSKAVVLDAVTGLELLVFQGPSVNFFGTSVLGIEDLDADGVADLLISESDSNCVGTDSGRVAAFSGSTGLELYSVCAYSGWDRFSIGGLVVMGDLDGDNVQDWMGNAPDYPGGSGGYFRCISGQNGATLWDYWNPLGGGDLYCPEGIADVNGDGFRDVIGVDNTSGILRMISGVDGTLVWATSVPSAVVQSTIDVDGDSIDDLAVISASNVELVSGVDGSLLGAFSYTSSSGAAAGIKGHDCALDWNGDGRKDLIIGDKANGQVHIWSLVTDCNNNGIHDSIDIANGTSLDCNVNQVPDECELAVDMSLDWNGDGVIDACSSANYCYSNLNQAGLFGAIRLEGTPLIADNDFTMIGENLPVNVFGYFLFSQNQGLLDPFGGGFGVLCLGPPIKRFNSALDGGEVLHSGFDGVMSFSADLSGLPQGVVLQAGDTWNFQLWHREFDPSTGAPTSNTTDGIQVMFR